VDDRTRQPSDVGRDAERDLGDEPPAAIRDRAPDYRAPIDQNAPVSGHVAPRATSSSIAETPEHDWGRAARIVFPALRPVGTKGIRADRVDRAALAAEATRAHSEPLLDAGPADIPVVYAIPADGFDVIVNADHLVTWGVPTDELRTIALRNLSTWSAGAAWTDEVSGDRRLLSSDTGDGWDAARILLPEVRAHLAHELGTSGRVLVGLPERHLLIAGTLARGDDEFANLFADFVVEHSAGADEPIDRRVFELVDGTLVEFDGDSAGR
jgi:hypothetical protein